MDNSGTYSKSPLILVVQQVREMETMIRSGILSCPTQLEFCGALHDQVIHHIELDHPGLIIAPLQMDDMNAADLVQEVILKTGEAIPGIYICDPKFHAIQEKLVSMGVSDFLPKNFSMQDLLSKVAQMGSVKREYRSETAEPTERKKSTAA